MSESKDRWEFYKDARNKWRWRRVANNGRIIAASTEGYSRRTACVKNAKVSGYESGEAASSK